MRKGKEVKPIGSKATRHCFAVEITCMYMSEVDFVSGGCQGSYEIRDASAVTRTWRIDWKGGDE